MTKNLIIPVWAVILTIAVPSEAVRRTSKKPRPLPDGFVLSGVDGTITNIDSSGIKDKWTLKLNSDLITEKARIFAGTQIELLPSATLEKMTAHIENRSNPGYRLWGRVTKYQGKNFIFPVYFLPLTEAPKPKPKPQIQQSPQQKPQQQKPQLTVNDPQDQLNMPDEILKKLQTTKTIQPQQPVEEALELKQDFILADRIGFIVEQSKIENQKSKIIFVLDSLGRNPSRLSFKLLPCQALQLARQRQSAELDPLRFKISGIVTKYKNNHYLLLQRATRLYSHGNFPK